MSASGMVKGAAGAALAATLLAADLARHAAWYVSYRTRGETRDAERTDRD